MHPVLHEALSRSPVMPVLVIPEISMAAPLAEALASGGLTVFEITLRTDCALDAMVAMKDAVPDALIGAGTVTSRDRMREARDSGADFVVSPGTTQALWNASVEYQLPILPGFSSASEAMALMGLGSQCGKFFPAEASGGVNYLKSLAGPLPDFLVCPTGGIKADTADDYLACPNVVCVGGSWIAPTDLLAQGDYAEIEARARHA
ncbi:MAG: bifunctional 4-hydroxy-2-oxoglutarate aldolase/2-dehydro-3-deoxy-phosphogluconate aldolase, partial [Gammaproteobacteria bacterium]